MPVNKSILTCVIATFAFSMAASTYAQATTFTGTQPSGPSVDNWNVPANWDLGVPTGTDNAVISAGSYAQATSNATPAYSGSVTLGASSTLRLAEDDDLNALGGGLISLDTDSELRLRGIGAEDFTSRDFALLGNNATISVGESTASAGTVIFGDITGAFGVNFAGNNNSRARLTVSHDFTSFTTLGNRGFGDANFIVEAFAAGSLGTGVITVNDSDSILLGALDAVGITNQLVLLGASASKPGINGKIQTDFDYTVSAVTVNGNPLAPGIYTSSEAWLGGTGSITVIPEPASLVLLAAGGLLIAGRRQNRR